MAYICKLKIENFEKDVTAFGKQVDIITFSPSEHIRIKKSLFLDFDKYCDFLGFYRELNNQIDIFTGWDDGDFIHVGEYKLELVRKFIDK